MVRRISDVPLSIEFARRRRVRHPVDAPDGNDHAVAVNQPTRPDARTRLIAAITDAAAAAFGAELPTGTTVVASPARAGSNVAVAHPLGDRTIVWCSPGPISVTLDPLNGEAALGNEDFLDRTRQLGGVFVGAGQYRVLSTAAPDPLVESSATRRPEPG